MLPASTEDPAPPRRNSARPGGASPYPSPHQGAHGTFTEHPHHEHHQGDTVTTPPPGQPYPPHQPYPGPYSPPPPKKGMSTGAVVAITLSSVFAAIVLAAILAAGGNTDDKTSGKTTGSVQTATAAPSPDTTTEEPAEEPLVKVTAKKTKFVPSILNDGGKFTSVEVTIVNSGEGKISVNPLNFTITDTTGLKHQAELGEDKNQIDTMDLEPGEKATGVITGKGKFTAKYVTYTDGWFGEGIRGTVS